MNNNWIVYKHTFPDGKIYIGVTGRDPETRWDNGFGYIHERRIFNAIVSQGWDNVKHEILFSGLSENDAKSIEKKLIKEATKSCKSKVLNVQHNVRESISKSWIYEKITAESIKRFAGKFMFLDDYWLEKYKHLRGYFPFSTKISVGHVTLQFFEMKNGKVNKYEYQIDYPDYVTTFKSLYDFLMTGASGEWVKGQ